MTIRSLSMVCAILIATAFTGASAQIVVSIGHSRASACYLAAKTGFSPEDGIKICDESLRDENLSLTDRAATYDNRGILENAIGKFDMALVSFNAAIATNGSLGDAYVNRGAILIRQKKYEDALADINKGIGLGMSSPHIGYYNRAAAEELIGRYSEAYYDYMHALELEPSFVAARERLKIFTVIRPGAAPANQS